MEALFADPRPPAHKTGALPLSYWRVRVPLGVEEQKTDVFLASLGPNFGQSVFTLWSLEFYHFPKYIRHSPTMSNQRFDYLKRPQQSESPPPPERMGGPPSAAQTDDADRFAVTGSRLEISVMFQIAGFKR